MNDLPILKVAVAHLGSRWNYDVPCILEALGLLTRFYTNAYCGEGSWLATLRWLPSSLASDSVQRLQSRIRGELLQAETASFEQMNLLDF